ncbi:MAG: branched-chain amino acid ABC transporter permease [Pseudorhodoplanes sp.]|uniref:branched-chain amino acid ABC transporter permease n=1 Tax=Pseudorhodoplanes sp. TaxID=1934341 RepID=UPI003D13FEBA
MMWTYIAEQCLNGVQLGATLFLMTAGLTLTFGVMGLVNLAHGSIYMVGAFVCAYITLRSGSLAAGIASALASAAIIGALLETGVFRRLYARSHLDQVLATFALILIFNGLTKLYFGRQPYQIDVPEFLSGAVHIGESFSYPLYRLVIVLIGLIVAASLYYIIARTRVGMLIRAGSTNRDMVRALGVDLPLLFTLVFALGAVLAGLAGAIIGPVQAVEVGMGDQMVILAFVVIIIGGVGSVRGAMIASLMVGITDTVGRTVIPQMLKSVTDITTASALGAAISSTSVYLLMIVVLLFRPTGILSGRI